MLINLRDKKKKLIVKDILDIDFDMMVEEEDNKYYVAVNTLYRLDEIYKNEQEAEEEMLRIADVRNREEAELLSC